MVAIQARGPRFFCFREFPLRQAGELHPFAPNGIHGVLTAASIVFFAYIGFRRRFHDGGGSAQSEARHALGIIGSLIICTIFYALIAAVFTGMIPYGALVKTLGSEQAEPLTLAMKFVQMPNWMVGVVALGSVIAHTACCSCFSSANREFSLPCRAMGCSRRFSREFTSGSRRRTSATIITGVFVGGAALFSSLEDAVDFTNIGTLFAFFLVAIGIIILRYQDPNREKVVPRARRRMAGADPRRDLLHRARLSTAASIVVALRDLVRHRPGPLLLVRLRHSRLRLGMAGGPRPPDFNPEQQLPQKDVDK